MQRTWPVLNPLQGLAIKALLAVATLTLAPWALAQTPTPVAAFPGKQVRIIVP
jgi:hypothetical protein